jgi:hypothetical protein
MMLQEMTGFASIAHQVFNKKVLRQSEGGTLIGATLF